MTRFFRQFRSASDVRDRFSSASGGDDAAFESAETTAASATLPGPTSGEFDEEFADRAAQEFDAESFDAPQSAVSTERPEYVSASGEIDWDAALRANEGWIRGTIAARVGESAAVEEVFQNVALASVRQRAPIRDPSKIGSWFYRLATIYSLLYRRAVGRKKKLLKRYEEKVPPVERDVKQPEPLQWLLLEERREQVRKATAALPEDERRILTLKYSDDKSYKEIADELGTTVSAVQSKLYRARGRLREALTRYAPNDDGA